MLFLGNINKHAWRRCLFKTQTKTATSLSLEMFAYDDIPFLETFSILNPFAVMGSFAGGLREFICAVVNELYESFGLTRFPT